MKRIILILIAIVFLFGLVSCTYNNPNNTESKENETSEKQQYNIDENSLIEYYKSEEEVYEINTKHCQLFFPTKWRDTVKTVVYEDETMYKVSFYATFGSETIPLYDFVFGESQEGYILGTVKTDIGEQSVYLVDLSSLYDGQLPENLEIIYYEMCEGVNDIISNLVYIKGMVLVK